MPQCVAFDLYDEHWRDCWLAATSAARLRKKQVDIDIQQRINRLLADYGPQSERPLTLRIYGTMLKGFCVINNERARTLGCDCERVVFTFARKPFAEGDNTIRLPAAKRPRMEAALTLDLDLARVEASEAFDWTQAPLEEGALLRLSGAQMQQDAVPPCLDFGGIGFAAEAAGLGAPTDAGWLPRLPGEAAFVETVPEAAMHDPLLLSQLVLPDGAPQALGADVAAIPPHESMQAEVAAVGVAADAESLARLQHHRRRDVQVRPGVVYGFDAATMIAAETYSLWQQGSSEMNGGRTRPAGYAAMLSAQSEISDRSGPFLRTLIDATDGPLSWQVPSMSIFNGQQEGGSIPDVQALLSAAGQDDHAGVPGMAFPTDGAEAFAPYSDAPWGAEMQQLGLCPEQGDDSSTGNVEAQDERTAQVAAILRGCLRNAGAHGIIFDTLVSPGAADAQTAACTFSALLALASAGEFNVKQTEAYGNIFISTSC